MSVETPTPQAVRVRILDAAEQVVARDGVANLTLEAVAREAQVSKGGLLYHFPSKSALVMAVVERLACRCQDVQAQIIQEGDGSPGSFTRAYVKTRAQRHKDSKEAPLFTALLAAAGTDPQYLEPFRARVRIWQQRLEADGIDPVTSTMIRLVMDGLALNVLLKFPDLDPQLREDVLQRLIDMTRGAGS